VGELLGGFGVVLAYFALSATAALVLRRLASVPTEVFRKLLHLILIGSVFVWLYAFPTWWLAALAVVLFTVLVFPILWAAERLPGYSALLTQREPGEIKSSLVIVFGMFTVLIGVCWGALGERYLIVAAVLAWGLGDAAAALVGRSWGRHHLQGRLIDGRKTLEGTLAMFAVSFAAVLGVLLVRGGVGWPATLAVAAITAAVTAGVELCTKNGLDTLTCPLAAASTLIPLSQLWGM
jgi:dolichol kinase